jgi:hypothetical protein
MVGYQRFGVHALSIFTASQPRRPSILEMEIFTFKIKSAYKLRVKSSHLSVCLVQGNCKPVVNCSVLGISMYVNTRSTGLSFPPMEFSLPYHLHSLANFTEFVGGTSGSRRLDRVQYLTPCLSSCMTAVYDVILSVFVTNEQTRSCRTPFGILLKVSPQFSTEMLRRLM